MFLLPFIIWRMASEGGWNVLWAFPLYLVALFAYSAVLLLVLGYLAVGAEWAGERAPRAVKTAGLAIGVAVYTLAAAVLLCAFGLFMAAGVASLF